MTIYHHHHHQVLSFDIGRFFFFFIVEFNSALTSPTRNANKNLQMIGRGGGGAAAGGEPSHHEERDQNDGMQMIFGRFSRMRSSFLEYKGKRLIVYYVSGFDDDLSPKNIWKHFNSLFILNPTIYIVQLRAAFILYTYNEHDENRIYHQYFYPSENTTFFNFHFNPFSLVELRQLHDKIHALNLVEVCNSIVDQLTHNTKSEYYSCLAGIEICCIRQITT